MTTPEEFSKKQTVTIGLIIWVAAISFSMGMIYARIVDHTKDIKAARDFVEQEVGGLRSDWERDRESQNKRIDKIENKLFNGN